MKRGMFALFAAVGLLAMALPVMALDLGSAIPMADNEMKSVDGTMVSVNSVQGEKGTLVVFSCVHCPYVVAWNERMTTIGNAAQKMGVGVVFINSNDPKAYPSDNMDGMKKLAKDSGYAFPFVADEGSKMAKAFGATRTPEAFLFDASGKLVYHGTIDDNSQDANAVEKTYLKDAVQAVSEGKMVPMAETKAIGCGIKFQS